MEIRLLDTNCPQTVFSLSRMATSPCQSIVTLSSFLKAALFSRVELGWKLFAFSLSSHLSTVPQWPEHPYVYCLEPWEAQEGSLKVTLYEL